MPLQVADVAIVLIGAALGACPLLYPLDHYLGRPVGRYVSLIAIAATIPLTVLVVARGETLSLPLTVDSYALTLSALASAGAFFALLASLRTCKELPLRALYYIVPISLLGVYFTALARDAALFLAAWFMISVTSIAIIALGKDRASVQGAVKYAVLGMVATSILIFSIAALTTLSEELMWSELRMLDDVAPATALAAVLLLVALSFKLGAFPFHWWLPDAYGGIVPILVAVLTGCAELMPVVALARFVSPLSPALPSTWILAVSALSILSMTYGNVIALVQRNYQRMMAYAVIADVGYLLIGFAPYGGERASRVVGLEAVLIEAIALVLATVAIFTFAHYVRDKLGTVDLASMVALGRVMPLSSLSIVIAFFSVIGIPPLVGFWGKLYLFTSVITVAPWLAAAGVINSGISAGYYAMVLKQLYFVPGGPERRLEEAKDPEVIVMLACALLSVAFGLGLAPYLAAAVTPR